MDKKRNKYPCVRKKKSKLKVELMKQNRLKRQKEKPLGEDDKSTVASVSAEGISADGQPRMELSCEELVKGDGVNTKVTVDIEPNPDDHAQGTSRKRQLSSEPKEKKPKILRTPSTPKGNELEMGKKRPRKPVEPFQIPVQKSKNHRCADCNWMMRGSVIFKCMACPISFMCKDCAHKKHPEHVVIQLPSRKVFETLQTLIYLFKKRVIKKLAEEENKPQETPNEATPQIQINIPPMKKTQDPVKVPPKNDKPSILYKLYQNTEEETQEEPVIEPPASHDTTYPNMDAVDPLDVKPLINPIITYPASHQVYSRLTQVMSNNSMSEFGIPVTKNPEAAPTIVIQHNPVNNTLAIYTQKGQQKNMTTNVSQIRKDTTANVSQIRKDLTGNVSQIRKDTTANVSHIRKDVTGNVSQIRKDVAGNVSKIRKDTKANVSQIRKDVAGNVSQIRKDVTANVPQIRKDVTANISQTRMDTTEPANVIKIVETDPLEVANVHQVLGESLLQRELTSAVQQIITEPLMDLKSEPPEEEYVVMMEDESAEDSGTFPA